MKTTSKLVSVILLIAFLSCISSPMYPQPSPKISTKHTNEEIDKLIKSYKFSKSIDVNPTAQLSQKFASDFPNAYDVDWEEATGIYEVDFEIEDTDYEAYYDNNANLLMYIIEISSAKVPAIVKNSAIAKYPDYKLERDAKKIIKGTDTLYNIELEKGKVDVKLTITNKGVITKEIID